jgi:hypothetical protein
MGKFVKEGMSEVEVLDIGQNLAEWANHATGSGKGSFSKLGGEVLFGPKLTEAKVRRVTTDPLKTAKTFANWGKATPGEKAAAWTRLSGATQFLATNLGFLAANQGLLYALGSKEEVNYKNPMKGDWMAFKGEHMHGYVPGLHTEIRTLAKFLAVSFASKKELRGESRFSGAAKIVGQYGMAKLTPSIQRPLEIGFGQDWLGRPLPWSAEEGTERQPKLTYGEYAGDIGPIPLSGPIGYVYDQLQKTGMNKGDSLATVKALITEGLSDPTTWIIFGVGTPGFHVREEHPAAEKPASKMRYRMIR